MRSQDALQAINEVRPSIVHFSGHGTIADTLVLLDDQGQPKHIPMEAIMSAMALSLAASLSAYAQEAVVAPEAAPYAYGMHLDITNVIHIAPTADVCGPTSVQMTYRDSNGGTHILEYSVYR